MTESRNKGKLDFKETEKREREIASAVTWLLLCRPVSWQQSVSLCSVLLNSRLTGTEEAQFLLPHGLSSKPSEGYW